MAMGSLRRSRRSVVRASGIGGELRVGYQCAAVLGAWSLEATPTVPMLRFVITARIVTSNTYWLATRPLTLCLQFGRFRWAWEHVCPVVDGRQLQLTVTGKPQVSAEVQLARTG